MDFEQALNRIYNRPTSSKLPNLAGAKALLKALGNPHLDNNYVHVAGTSGKGSTCSMIAEVTRLSGLKTGLFISPYVINFCERIQINGEMISKYDVINLSNLVCDIADKLDVPITFFEIVTAMAFLHFKHNKCDIIVLETGIGGLYDTTNVITNPLVTIINSVGYDHMELLGNTIKEIATRKCGIIKQNGITITTHTQKPKVMEIIKATTLQKQNQLVITNLPEVLPCKDKFNNAFNYNCETYKLAMAGKHQINNALLCIECCFLLQSKFSLITKQNIKIALEQTVLPARQEILCKKPIIILDGAHNVDKITALVARLDELKCDNCTFIVGMLGDKQIGESLDLIKPYCKKLICVDIDNSKAILKQELQKTALNKGINAICAINYDCALNIYNSDSKNPLIICGSLYLCSSIREKALSYANKFINQ